LRVDPANGVNRGRLQGAAGHGAIPCWPDRRLKHFTRYLSSAILFIIVLIPVMAGFGLPCWVAWIWSIAFLVGLRQANIDYKRLISTSRYTVQPNWSAGVSSPHGRSPFSPANMPASQTINTIMWSLGNEAPFSEGK
jgi:hypothetical protein